MRQAWSRMPAPNAAAGCRDHRSLAPALSGPLGWLVHPRVGGEHHPSCRAASAATGPPPHRRGARAEGVLLALGDRSTPASAGSTRLWRSGTGRRAVHPRIGEEHTGYRAPELTAYGPPPHRRGALLPRRPGLARERSTPASAGSTRRGGRGGCRPSGPPPHRRGALDLVHPGQQAGRSTPASAGSTHGPGHSSAGGAAVRFTPALAGSTRPAPAG